MSKVKRTITDKELEIGQRIKSLRTDQGISQNTLSEQLTTRLGYTLYQPTINDIETGKLRLHAELILALSDILNCNINELLGLSTTKLNSSLSTRFNKVNKLPEADQKQIIELIDVFLKGK